MCKIKPFNTLLVKNIKNFIFNLHISCYYIKFLQKEVKILNLKQIRISRNKTQGEVAKALGISQQNYCRYENGQNEPRLELILQLSDYFKVTVDSLLGHNVPYLLDKSLLSKNQLEALDLIMNLNNENIIRVISYCAGLLATQK